MPKSTTSPEALRDKAVADGATTQRERIEHKQRINDQAYFVLAWGQLEADIVDACRSTIRHAQTHGDWRDRRAWTQYNPDDRRLSGLSFENRLTLVLEKRSENWKKVSQHYSIRNQIAHGRLRSQRIDVSRVIACPHFGRCIGSPGMSPLAVRGCSAKQAGMNNAVLQTQLSTHHLV